MPKRAFALIFILALAYPTFVTAQRRAVRPAKSAVAVPVPEEVLGFRPGEDRKLASWNQVLSYFEKLAAASNRVNFEALGKSTMDLPFVMATISAPENLRRLEEYKKIQELLADPRKLGRNPDARSRQLIARGKTVVLITCGIHSTEVGSYLSSMLIAHRLASSDEPEIVNILRNTIVLIVPSLNPDGVDIVKNWYDQTLGTPYEGTNPPELYHKYVGHDNNRDWYAFTQVETQITVSKIHNVWRPQIVHDIHQQSAFGARFFVPPYMPPVEPNVPKQIVEGYTELGSWIADQMRSKGFKGITTNSSYDAWTPARAYSHYHGGVRILSETASARIASPITLKLEQLTAREGIDAKKESPNFGPLWEGGEWSLSEITKYMTTAAFLLMRHAAENRVRWLERFYEVGKEAVRPRKDGELWGFVVSLYGDDFKTLKTFSQIINEPTKEVEDYDRLATVSLLHTLKFADVEMYRVLSTSGSSPVVERGDFVIPVSQPYGAFAKAVLEKQKYPDLRNNNGEPISPYDVTAHTLPLLMGVTVKEVDQTTSKRLQLQKVRTRLPIALTPCMGLSPCSISPAVYKSHVPSMDEGWTRWILQIPSALVVYSSVDDQQIKNGLLKKDQVLVFPDQPANTILNGHRPGTMSPEYTGGLGEEGVKALREFVEDGGTLVFLNRASDFAIEQFKLPVRNVVAELSRKEFYVPGSILRIELDVSHPLATGMPNETIAWVENSPVFEIEQKENSDGTPGLQARVVGWYPKDKDPLLSGWLLGGDRLKGKAALVEVTMGKGRVVLFGFRPQYRGQSLATYPLLFNALRQRSE